MNVYLIENYSNIAAYSDYGSRMRPPPIQSKDIPRLWL